MSLRVLMLGDIVGAPGCQAVAQQLPLLREKYQPDLVIANAENASRGSGLTPQLYNKLVAAGIDGMTLGDHVFKKAQIMETLQSKDNIIRPANLPRAAVGRSWMRLTAPGKPPLFVMTVLGRIGVSLPADDPFAAVDQVLTQLPEMQPIVLVEIHAEATSEKQAVSRYLDGRVSAVVGTHTHVATADARILPKGTGYITDLGMTGPQESIIGRDITNVVKYMTTSMHAPFDVATGDPRVCGVFLEIDENTRRTVAIERVEVKANPKAPPFTAS